MSQLKAAYTLPTGQRLEITQGDLTREPVDAIVNAANEHLAHGGGIAHAIVRAGGDVIQRESHAWVKQHGPISHATTAYTNAGSLSARYVIHAVGPVMGSGDEDKKLHDAVTASLRRADELGLRSIALPSISTGIFGFPKDRAARVFFQAIPAYFTAHTDTTLHLVRITLWDNETLAAYLAAARSAFGAPENA